ncbi:hypothetical protein DL93DRAFT_2097241 [Clavulina sp. PMI_390]|nr:hypothetical protein DL93DRAFT_2097241 [Clavulina sp. PMI_390]
MSATETTLRRSGRERTQTKLFVSQPSAKRKRDDASEDERDDNDIEDDPSSDETASADSDDEEPEFPDPKPKKKPAPARPTKATAGTKPPAAKKPRAAPVRRGRKLATSENATTVKDASINDDNALFNALINPSTALESTVQDFLDSLSTTPEAASADLVTCVFRLCGCNTSVNSDEVMDSDGILDFLNDVVEEIKGTEAQAYPLISKSPIFRKLRKSLSEFCDRLVKSASESDALFTSELMPTFQAWIVAMSSAHLRSFRHTATVVALEIETALCTIAAAIEKDAETVGRQKDAERKKRKGSGGVSEREKTLNAKAAEIKGRKTKISEYLQDFFDGVFVHRYRDADAGIRADCVREMGQWLRRHPSHFLEGNYLRYVGWVLSDTNTNVRLEAVKSLQSLYAKPEYLITIQHFTERFKPRLIAIATSDTDLAVRVAVIHVLRAIDAASLLDEDQRSELCVLIFDEEARVRKAISGFVKGIWEETTKERLVGRDDADDEDSPASKYAGAKALASLLVSWERALSRRATTGASDDTSQMSELPDDQQTSHQTLAASLSSLSQRGRTALAVEALWDEVDAVRDWESLLEILLLDHSGAGAVEKNAPSTSNMRKKGSSSVVATPAKKRRANGRAPATPAKANDDDEDEVDEAWRLEEDEERALVEVLLACLQKTLADEGSKKGGDLDSVQVDTTRALIKVLPKLFTRHQTDPARMAELLKLPQLMRLDLFLEMRMMTAYETLWDDITKQIVTQTAPALLSSALSAMSHMLNTPLLSNTNATKLLELDEELAENLREAVTGHAELDTASFSSEEIDSLSAITTRLARMAERRDLTTWMEDDDSGKRSSAWDILSALMERGRLGRKEEELFVNNAINLLALHVAWRASKLRQGGDDEAAVERLQKQRDYLVEQLAAFVAAGQFNTTNEVKRTAFQSLITLHILFARDQSPTGAATSSLSKLVITMDERLQHQCAGFIQAEAEAFAEVIAEREAADESVRAASVSDDDQMDEDSVTPTKTSRKKNATSNGAPHRKHPKRDVAADLANEYSFISVISYFIRAVTPGVIDPSHASVLLAYHGRLGTQFDHCLSTIVVVLREEGIYNKNGELVEHVVGEALRQSFTMFMDGQTDSVLEAVGLAKALSPAFAIRGAHLSIVQRLASDHVIAIHTTLLSWIVKRIATYDASGNKKKRADSIEFFRVLHALLNTVDSREAMQIKSHLDKALDDSKLEVPPTAKAWDAERLYEKRLLGAMAKDKTIVAKGKAIAAERRAADETETEGENADLAPKKKRVAKPPKPRAQGTRRSTRVAGAASSGEEGTGLTEPEEDDEDHDIFGSRTASQASPKKATRPKPKPRYAPESDNEPSEGAATPTPAPSSPEASPPTRKSSSPFKGRKRAREDDDDDGEEAAFGTSPRQARQSSPAISEASEVVSTRKRARR